MDEFYRIKRLPPYVFAIVNDLKTKARARGEDIIDLGMGNPDLGTPRHIVAKLCEAAQNPKNHRYSASRGITRLRVAIAKWYRDRYGVEIDPESEAIATIGAKEGLAHLALAVLQPGDGALVPNPTYPIHSYSVVIAGGDLRSVPLTPDGDFFARLEETAKLAWPKAKLLILSFPHNPTTTCVDRAFFERVVDFAREHRLMVVHDFAYADLAYDGYRPPSFLEAPGAKDVGVEFFSLTKSYNMAGWRLAFCCGNRQMVHALARIKSYLDYGVFQPIQIAGIVALEGDQSVVGAINDVYRKRRDVLVDGLNKQGWSVPKPKGTMFVWAPIPEEFRVMGSLEFAKLCVQEAKVAVSPGIGFGEYGEGYVRFALVENEQRIRQALRGLKHLTR
ncbi:MAG: aminotransferase class I/II-fold pyridoxal phosphate-dependent enzyme [Candidatus Rokubacteria bacterium]|jgi:alanine-synthesizing transaminase|nr:aminotransferase class I/II-fold pyridoxal phosphate-dependent enzyme [Candidatus Rokubacteria bacterium]